MYMMKEDTKHCALKRKRAHPKDTIPWNGNEQNGEKTDSVEKRRTSQLQTPAGISGKAKFGQITPSLSMVRVAKGALAEAHCGDLAGSLDSRDGEVRALTGGALSTSGHLLSRSPLSVGTALEGGTGNTVPSTL
jgi:hypothetical protein